MGGVPIREREKGREKEKKNGYKSLSAMSSTTISSFCIQNDDDDDGRRSGICTHSTWIDEMFIFNSSECKYFVYTYSHCIKREDWINWYKTRNKESEFAFSNSI